MKIRQIMFAVHPRDLFFIITASVGYVLTLLLVGAYSLDTQIYAQTLVIELLRVAFCYSFWKLLGRIIAPAVLFSITETFFASVVNLIFFQPEYFTNINAATLIALLSLSCSLIIGILAGFSYRQQVEAGYPIFWGMFAVYFLQNGLRGPASTSSFLEAYVGWQIAFYLMYLIVLLCILAKLFSDLPSNLDTEPA